MKSLVSLWMEALEESCPRCDSDDVDASPVDHFPAVHQRCYECGYEWHRFSERLTIRRLTLK